MHGFYHAMAVFWMLLIPPNVPRGCTRDVMEIVQYRHLRTYMGVRASQRRRRPLHFFCLSTHLPNASIAHPQRPMAFAQEHHKAFAARAQAMTDALARADDQPQLDAEQGPTLKAAGEAVAVALSAAKGLAAKGGGSHADNETSALAEAWAAEGPTAT